MLEFFRLRLRTILLIVNLTVLVLPLGSLLFFRIYENQLVRQTESDLIAQAAVIAATYREEIISRDQNFAGYGIKAVNVRQPTINDYYAPIDPGLDLSKDILLPDRPAGRKPDIPPDELAIKAGERVTRIITEAQKNTLADLKLLEYHGVVVAGRFEVGDSFSHLTEIASALKGHYTAVIRSRIPNEPLPGVASLSRGTGIRVFVAYPILYKDRLWGVAYLSRTPSNILKQLYTQKRKVMFAGLSILVITFALALLTSATISRPIRRLIERARAISRGDTSKLGPMPRPGTVEMAQLSKSFSDMSTSLHERSEYIRNFASHVSHEFKTPLTSIQGAAELLEEHFDTMSADERQKFISNINSDANRLRQLVTRLLELARADSITPSSDAISLDDALAQIRDKYQGKDFTINLPAPTNITIPISYENFETILSNLAENSKIHNATCFDISATTSQDKLILTLTDNGSGISKANLKKIFTPFFTTRRQTGGTGLGLGIAASIVAAHKGEIRAITYEGGARFELVLPVV